MVASSLALFALLAGPGQLGAAGRTTWGGDLILYPAKKLVFCTIPKNACTQFMRIFLGFNNKVKDAKTWDDWFNMVTLHSMGMSRDDVSRSKGYKWGVFLRDPLARYLSAWGSKCFQKEDDWNCVGDLFSDTGSVEDFEAHVLAISRNPEKLKENSHWAPQQSMCGGLKNAKDYDFVGNIDGGTDATNSQVHAMLKMVGAPEDEVDAEFPKGAVARHHSSLDMDVYYRNDTIRRMVRDFYRSDYELPGLA